MEKRVRKTLKERVAELKKQVFLLYLAAKHPRVPWYAKAFTILVVAYALSPVDLIPDFIPVLGYLDDLLLIPLGIYLALKMIPKDVLEDLKREAEQTQSLGRNWIAGVIIIAIWLLVLFLVGRAIWKAVRGVSEN